MRDLQLEAIADQFSSEVFLFCFHMGHKALVCRDDDDAKVLCWQESLLEFLVPIEGNGESWFDDADIIDSPEEVNLKDIAASIFDFFAGSDVLIVLKDNEYLADES